MQDIKIFLRSYVPAMKYAEKCFRELDSAEDIGISSPKLDGMPRASDPHGLEEQVARIEAIRKKAEEARDRVLEMLDEIEDRIETLEDYTQRSAIKLHYIYGMTWDEVAMELGYSLRRIHVIHGKALMELRRATLDTQSVSEERRKDGEAHG